MVHVELANPSARMLRVYRHEGFRDGNVLWFARRAAGQRIEYRRLGGELIRRSFQRYVDIGLEILACAQRAGLAEVVKALDLAKTMFATERCILVFCKDAFQQCLLRVARRFALAFKRRKLPSPPGRKHHLYQEGHGPAPSDYPVMSQWFNV